MKRFSLVIMTLTLLCCLTLPSFSEPRCPEDQYYEPRLKRCVYPGDGDPDADRQFERELMAECQNPCGDGWCCNHSAGCQKCRNETGSRKSSCYLQYECWKKLK